MGCSCSGKVAQCIKIEEHFSNKKTFNGPTHTIDSEICESSIIIAVWASSDTILNALFPTKLFTHHLCQTQKLRFNLIPYYSNTTQIKDALLFLSENKHDKEKIKKICSETPKICQKFLICPNSSIKLSQKLLQTTNTIEEFCVEFVKSYSNLNCRLKEMFAEADKFKTGALNVSDLATLLTKSKIQFSDLEIREYFARVLDSKEKKMDLEEFLYWFRRGRQGALPLLYIVEAWLDQIKTFLPTIERDLKSAPLSKKTLKKSVSLVNATELKPSFRICISLANSLKKEAMLRSVTEIFNLHIYEFWFSFQLEYKCETTARYSLVLFQDLIQSLKIALLVNTSSVHDIEHSIHTDSVCIGTKVYICVAFDITNDIIEQACMFLQDVDELLKSPTDDYIELQVSRKSSIVEQSAVRSLAESLADAEVLITGEHWARFSEMVDQSSEKGRIFNKFLELDGELRLQSDWLAGLPSLRSLLDIVCGPIKTLVSRNFCFGPVLEQFNREVLPVISVLSRIGSYGVAAQLFDANLEEYLSGSG